MDMLSGVLCILASFDLYTAFGIYTIAMDWRHVGPIYMYMYKWYIFHTKLLKCHVVYVCMTAHKKTIHQVHCMSFL